MPNHEEYREQTEEDLQNVPPMSRMQKTILTLALIGVACAVIYSIAVYMDVI